MSILFFCLIAGEWRTQAEDPHPDRRGRAQNKGREDRGNEHYKNDNDDDYYCNNKNDYNDNKIILIV